jgi:AcrR family transcriptional regulator
MNQEERSERSREQILNAALKLFSHRGYGATSVRDIAEEAGLSKGNVYHHFPDKETIFRALLDAYFQAVSRPDFPFNRVLATGTFPENLEELGRAARDVVIEYREYVALIYVDVVEFDGSHIRKFYEDMAQRFERFLQAHDMDAAIATRLAPGLSPTSAVMLATRIFFNYFSIEVLFGVKDHFGKSTEEVVGEIARILRHGMLKTPAAAAASVSKRSRKSAVPSRRARV